LILDCLEKDVDKRIASVDVLAARLTNLRSRRPRSKTWLYVVVAALVAAAATSLLLRSRTRSSVNPTSPPVEQTAAATHEPRELAPAPAALAEPPPVASPYASAMASAPHHAREPVRSPHAPHSAAPPSLPGPSSQDLESTATDRRK